MAALAPSQRDEISRRGRDHRFAALLYSPTVAAALLSGVFTIVVTVGSPMLAHTLQWQYREKLRWENHERALQIRTELAADMSKSYTGAIATAQHLASGLINGHEATVQDAYDAALGKWQIDGSRITATLAARYANNDIVRMWQRYRLAVTRFYRLSAALPRYERDSFVRYVRSYFMEMRARRWASRTDYWNPDWRALQQSRRFRKSVRYRRAYDQLSASFLSLGDAFVQELLKLHPEV